MQYVSPFDRNVFINCPFDEEYDIIFKSFVYTVLACGYYPVTALQISDSGQRRLDKIVQLIFSSKYSIHDISKVRLDTTTSLPRFNMPFELGIDIASRNYHNNKLKTKKMLIFESKKYQANEYLSDLSGSDKSVHQMNTYQAIKSIRIWLNADSEHILPSVKTIEKSFDDLIKKLPSICNFLNIDCHTLSDSYKDLTHVMREWIDDYPGLISNNTSLL